MIEYLALLALYTAVAWVTGMAVGEWTARRDARRTLQRRQILAGLHAVESARGRHLSRLP